MSNPKEIGKLAGEVASKIVGWVLKVIWDAVRTLQEDMKELSSILSQSWWITPNEKRAAMRYDVINDVTMDEVYIPAGYLPIAEVTALQDPNNALQAQDYNIPQPKNEK